MNVCLRPLLVYSIASAACFALRSVFIKAVGRVVSPAELLMWQGAVGVVVLGIYAGARKTTLVPARSMFKTYWYRVLFGMGNQLFLFVALIELPAAIASSLSFSAPLFLAVLAPLLINERTSLGQALAVMLGFTGICLSARPDLHGFDPWFLLAGLASGLCNGLMRVYVKKLTNLNEPGLRGVFWLSVVSFIFGLTWSCYSIEFHLPVLQTDVMTSVASMAFINVIAQVLAVVAFQYGPATTVCGLSFLTIPLTAIFGYILLEEQLDAVQLSGLTLTIVACLALLSIRTPTFIAALKNNLLTRK